VANEKPPRRTDEYLTTASNGFFLLSMIEGDFDNNPELQCIAASIPQQCKFVSTESQNEIISIWFDLVQYEISEGVFGSSMFCVIADETRNKNSVEDVCVSDILTMI
jgi:hypothetical protein